MPYLLLYYPKYLNITRCCVQPICTECFVQIKRSDPHPPYDDHDEDGANTPNSTTTPDSASVASNQTTEPLLVSEPAHCPYCMVTDFGVTFTPPHIDQVWSQAGDSKSLSQLGRLTASNNAKSAEDKTVVEDKSDPSFVSSTDAVTSPQLVLQVDEGVRFHPMHLKLLRLIVFDQIGLLNLPAPELMLLAGLHRPLLFMPLHSL